MQFLGQIFKLVGLSRSGVTAILENRYKEKSIIEWKNHIACSYRIFSYKKCVKLIFRTHEGISTSATKWVGMLKVHT